MSAKELVQRLELSPPPPKPAGQRGRKLEYSVEKAREILEYIADGGFAANCPVVHERTIRKWADRFPDFGEGLRIAKVIRSKGLNERLGEHLFREYDCEESPAQAAVLAKARMAYVELQVKYSSFDDASIGIVDDDEVRSIDYAEKSEEELRRMLDRDENE